jgi:hypothetical protein
MSDFESGAFNRALPPLRVFTACCHPGRSLVQRLHFYSMQPASISLPANAQWLQCLQELARLTCFHPSESVLLFNGCVRIVARLLKLISADSLLDKIHCKR